MKPKLTPGGSTLKGHYSYASSASDPHESTDFGKRPVVGQSKAYNSTNAHNKHETPRKNVKGGSVMPMSQPHKKTY